MFIGKLLPPEGKYCVAELLPGGGFRHYFYDEISTAHDQLGLLDRYGKTVYLAQASFDPAKIDAALLHNKGKSREERVKERSQDNALLLKNFFLDIDCGEKWPLKNQVEGLRALHLFIRETALPFPVVVNSGNGLYAHWILDQAIPAGQWRVLAFLLKQVVAAYSPAIGGDSSRTSDSASVLRLPGTTNRKPGKDPKTVRLVIPKDEDDITTITLASFASALEHAAKRKKIDRAAVLPPAPSTDINADYYAGLDLASIPSDADQVADRCAQLALMRQYRCNEEHDISHTLWFLLIGLLMHCENGEQVVYEWTEQHPTRNQDKTARTIEQWRLGGYGPSTCVAIGGENPAGCIGCPHKSKVKSPVILGRPDPVALQVPDEECGPPDGYRRSTEGLFVRVDDRWLKFYDQDLWVDRLAFDESLGHQVMTVKHHLPHEGELECTFRTSLCTNPRDLITTLYDNHIKVLGAKERSYMVGYLDSYQVRLQRQRKMTSLMSQMGWKEARNGKAMFVLGREIFHADGSIEEASLSRNVPRAVEAFHTSGELAPWSAATKVFGEPGMEPLAFAFLAGAFGAPLMKYSGYDGAMISLVGESGVGKTLVQSLALSAYGYHKELIMEKEDTKLSLIKRLAAYGNIMLAIDENTNMFGKELSDLVFSITRGRERTRLTQAAKEMDNTNRWNTLALTSANLSIVDRLSDTKHDASAEINRVFEYTVRRHAAFNKEVCEKLYGVLTNNYGHAGRAYIQHLVVNADKLPDALKLAKKQMDEKAGIAGEERYWGALIAVTLLGGLIAKKLGLIQFDVIPVMEWAAQMVRIMRTTRDDLTDDAVSVLAQYLDDRAPNTLVVTGGGRADTVIIQQPRGPLFVRHETSTNRCYASRSDFKAWLAARFGSYSAVRQELVHKKVLLCANKPKALGGGTFYGGGAQTTFEIDMLAPALGDHVADKLEIIDRLKEQALANPTNRDLLI